MARGGRPRPAPFPPGTKLGDHFRVEGLVRLAEGRMYYLLNDDRPDRSTRRCWECGHDSTPRSSETCQNCQTSLKDTRFLMSVRWDAKNFGPYQDFVKNGLPSLEHPGFVLPVDVFVQDGVLCSIYRYRGESLLLDECAPFTPQELLTFLQRVTGLAAWFSHRGYVLHRMGVANLLLDSKRHVVFYDPEISQARREPLPASEQARAVRDLTALGRRFCPVNCNAIRSLLDEADNGAFPDTMAFGSAVAGLFDAIEDHPAPLDASALTDVGLSRDLNEDNWSWVELAPGIFLYVVADGMGGHDSGEVASDLAVRTICKEAKERLKDDPNPTPEVLENILDEAFQRANNTIKDHAERRGNDMGTTLVAFLSIHGRQALLANVGDSRGYLLRDHVLHQVTRDHSLVARMVEQSRITPEEARNHPHSNILLRTVGTERNVEIDIFSVEIEEGDRVLLCSDGLWGEVEDEEIEVILNHYQELRMASRELIRAAHHGGGKDNITVVIVENHLQPV